MKKVAVVLFNLGGPTDLKSVKPFLFNLFKDSAIINLPFILRIILAKFIAIKRSKATEKMYKMIGGKSPLLQLTNIQAEALERELSFSDDHQYQVFVCMRYWYPMSKETVSKIKEYQADQIIMLPLYPQFSTATTFSSFKDFEKQIKKQKVNAQLKYVNCYPDNRQFIFAHTRLIKQTIRKAENAKYKYEDCRLLFSAHGLPQNIIDKGDPYTLQIQVSTKAIIKELEKNLNAKSKSKNKISIDYKICYQSKVGLTRWTSPSTESQISQAGIDKKAVIIVPISFVSDHLETLVELDIKYKELAKKKKVPFYLRVPALNDDGYFIKSLAKICQDSDNKDNIAKNTGFG